MYNTVRLEYKTAIIFGNNVENLTNLVIGEHVWCRVILYIISSVNNDDTYGGIYYYHYISLLFRTPSLSHILSIVQYNILSRENTAKDYETKPVKKSTPGPTYNQVTVGSCKFENKCIRILPNHNNFNIKNF